MMDPKADDRPVKLTDEQRELLEDKFILWDRASRSGNMELRDYNGRAAQALKVALAIASEGPRDWSELEDDIADAIGDSLDMDWSPRDGAKAVIRLLTERAGHSALAQHQGGENA